MPVPATKAQELTGKYALSLTDVSRFMDEPTIRNIIAEIRIVLRSVRSPADRAALHDLLSVSYFRLREHEQALSESKHALVLDPGNGNHRNNIAVNLTELGRFEEALEHLREARKLSNLPELTFLICVNEAEANHRLGRAAEARAAFESASASLDPDSASNAFVLALAAAELGAEDDAAEFFARYLAKAQGVDLGDTPAVEFIRAAPDALMIRAREPPALREALARVIERYDAPLPDDAQINAHIVVSPEAWDTIESLLANPPEPSEALRRLMYERRT